MNAREVRAALCDPATVARALALPHVKQGSGGVLARCPAHDDRGPSCSLTVGPDRTLRVRCFGCGLRGDVLHLVAAARGLDIRRDFRAVLHAAAELAGGAIDPPRAAAPRATRPTGEAFALVASALLAHGRLDGTAAADVARYLAARGVLEVARAEGWGAVLDSSGAAVRAEVGPEVCRASGLFLPSLDDLTFSGPAVAIPWRSPSGEIATLQRRLLGGLYVFPSSRPALWPYGAHRLARAPLGAVVAIVEGAADAEAFQLLHPGTVALGLPGVDSWSGEWAALLRGRTVLLATDNDPPGERAALRLRAMLAGIATATHRERPPGVKDWSDVLKARLC